MEILQHQRAKEIIILIVLCGLCIFVSYSIGVKKIEKITNAESSAPLEETEEIENVPTFTDDARAGGRYESLPPIEQFFRNTFGEQPVPQKGLVCPKHYEVVNIDNEYRCGWTEDYLLRLSEEARIDANRSDVTHQLASLKNVYKKDGEIFIDADYLDWQSEGNGKCTNDIKKTTQSLPECGPNGYNISNVNPKIRTLKLSNDAGIRLLNGGGAVPFPRMSADQFEQYFNLAKDISTLHVNSLLVNLYLRENGEVWFLHQQYVP